MPKIPTYNRVVQEDTPQVQSVPNPGAVRGAFGENVFQANQDIAKGIGDIGQVVAKRAEAQAKLQNDSFVADQDVKYTLNLQNRLNSQELESSNINGQKIDRPKGFLMRNGLSAQGSTVELDDWQRKESQSVLDSIKDPEIKLRVAHNMGTSYMSARNSLITHEAKQVREGYVKNLESSRDLKISDTSNVLNPNGINDSINKIAVLQDQINKANGYDPATSQLEFRKQVGSFVKNAIDSSLQVDPSGNASRSVLSNLKGKISDEEAIKLNDHIKKEVSANASILMDDLNSKFLDGSITLEDINSANKPKDQGGIGSASARKFTKDLMSVQAEQLTTIANDSTKADEYVKAIDGSLLSTPDNFKAKQILVNAYADGTMDQGEAQKLGRIRDIVTKQKFNRDHPALTNIGVIKAWFGANDSDSRELATTLQNYMTALDDGKKPEEATEQVLKNQYNKTYPEAPLGAEDKVNDPKREKQFSAKPFLSVIKDTLAIQKFAQDRLKNDVNLGTASLIHQFGGSMRWLGAENAGKTVEKVGAEAIKQYTPKDPMFADQLVAGVASSATLFIPGFGISKGVTLATAMPRLATLLGVSASTALEALIEAGGAKQRAMQKEGFSEKDSNDIASKVFWTNIPTLAITNKLGVFGENGSKFVKTLAASGYEGFQELSQAMITNFFVKDPILQGAFENATIGAVTGGGVKFAVESSQSLNDLGTAKEELDKFKESLFKASEDLSEKLASEQGSARISGENEGEANKRIEELKLLRNTDDYKNDKSFAKDTEIKISKLESERGSAINPVDAVAELAGKVTGSKIAKDLADFTDASMVPLSTRLNKINPMLGDALRKFEFNKGLSMHEDLQKALPFMKHLSAMPEQVSSELDLALKNADKQAIGEIVDRNGIRQEYEQVRETLDDLYNRAREVGIDVSYLDDYFPRRVNDPEAFLNYLRNGENWSAIDKAIKQEETKVGKRLDNEERAEFINKLLRGYGDSQIKISKPSNTKARKIGIIDEKMNSFYKNSATTLQEYIVAMNNAIAAKKFFGLNGKDVENSIGTYVSDLVDKGLINHNQEADVKSIIDARFKERGTHGIWSFYKNLGYLYTMSSPISAITQIGDLAFGLYENGLYSTAKGVSKAFSKNKITKQDLGIDAIIDEFSDQSKSGELVNKVFKMIGLEGMDNIGKEGLINGSMDQLSKKAIAGDKELKAELDRVFGEEAPQVLEDLKNQEPSENVKYMLFSRLAKYQPIALSEMPEYYAKGGNMRVFYMLKSYTIKQLDIFHNEVFRQMETNPKKAIGNLVKLSVAIASMNAGADAIKDVLLGRPIKLADIAVDNILRLVGFSKYAIYQARREGLQQAVFNTIAPPIPFVPDLMKDIGSKKDIPDYKIWNALPIIGKFYYWWFGGGREYLDKQNNHKGKKIKARKI